LAMVPPLRKANELTTGCDYIVDNSNKL